MRRIVISLFILGLSVAPVAVAKPSASKPAWLALTLAYPARRDNVIKKYTHSNVKSIRLYATALLDLSKRNFSTLPKDGYACYNAKPATGTDATAYFGCMFAVASGLGIAQQTKRSKIWVARVIAFYKRHSRVINKTAGSDNPANIKQLNSPSAAAIKKWPDQTVSVKRNWSDINLHNGIATAYIDGKPIPALVDTAATVIAIAKEDIKRYGLTSSLISLGVKGRIAAFAGEFASSIYYVKHFRLGPISISNAFITVIPNGIGPDLPGLTVGINVLSALKKFSISATSVSHLDTERPNKCGRMLFTRQPVSQDVSYPFLEVPTSFGRLGLYLDSGFHWSGKSSPLGIYLVPRERSELANYGAISSAKSVKSFRYVNGEKIFSQTAIFPVSVSGVQTNGIFASTNPADPMVAGAMVFGLLKKAKVAYDFPDRKMCIIPDSPPTPAKADKSGAKQ